MSTERDPVFGCELVAGRLDKDGYGFHGKSRAHIVAWERANGPVPEGKELDHLCRRRNCTAVHHLEPITRAEQEKRKAWSYRIKRTRCQRGHSMGLHHQVTPERGVVCRLCNRETGAIT